MISKGQIRKLRLKKGDVIVVRHPEDGHALSRLGGVEGIDFPVPVVCVHGSVHKLSREYLEKLLKLAK